MDAVVVDGLDVTRGGRPVLEDLALRVPEGRVTGLLGPSGCGKSTLMRAIVGTQVVASGEVTVLGRPAGSPPLRRRVGYVTQAPSVYGDLTVRENLRYFARVLGAAGGRGRPRARHGGAARDRDRAGGAHVGRPALARLAGGRAARARRGCWCWTSPPSASTRVLRRELWPRSTSWPTGHDHPGVQPRDGRGAECDLLLLMREGRPGGGRDARRAARATGVARPGRGVPAPHRADAEAAR